MATLNYPGPFCEHAGIICDALTSDSSDLPVLSEGDIVKGIAFELRQFQVENNLSWENFYGWITRLYPEPSMLPTSSALKVSITRLQSKIKELKRNKSHSKIRTIMNEPFIGRGFQRKKDTVVQCVKNPQPTFDVEVLSTVNRELASELAMTKEALNLQEMQTKELEAKFSKLSVRNTNKKLRRRDNKIAELKEEATECRSIENRLKQTELVAEKRRANLVYAKKKSESIAKEMEQLKAQTRQLDKAVTELHAELDCVQDEREFLQRVAELESCTFETKEHKQKYLDNVRQCCMELLSMNVGIKNIEPIIRSVLKHVAGLVVAELPHSTTLVQMLAEMKALSCQQLAEELGTSDNLTLHSDGTSKFGQHYYSYQVSTPSSTYSLGLSEMLTGSANQVLHTFKQILSDLELVAGPKSGGLVLAKVKNTMSDRHIVEKNFNSLLEDYRKEILPTVFESWDEMTPEQQNGVATLNNFFCGMHLLVGMADTASSTLLQWESTHFEGAVGPAGTSVLVRKSESGVVRLVRTACKALSKHGSEQSGVYQSFTSYLELNGIKRNPVVSFRGNRFNILFYDAGALYFVSDMVKTFFREVWQTPNQLLRAVLSDIQVPEYLAGCRALGLINKAITAPLWRILETPDISILDMNEYLQMLIAHLDLWSLDASLVLTGEAVLFPDFPPTEDPIWHSLTASSELDPLTQDILQIIFHAFSALLSRLVCDHLPGGVLDEACTNLERETQSVPKTNVVSERDFAKLDRFLREKPNASTLSLEALILFTNNKTAKWLDSKPQAEVKQLLEKARRVAPDFKRLYRERREKMLQERTQLLQAKQRALLAAQEKKLREKEKLTQDIMKYGLWQTQEDIRKGLSKLKSNSAKVMAIKTQLDFRRRVLEQKHPEKEVFFLSRNRKKLSGDELITNLGKLLSSPQTVDRHTAENHESLVGKRIRHKWCEDGVERWYNGQILSVVDGTNEWFNVQYDGEDEILTLNLFEDIENGDLDIAS